MASDALNRLLVDRSLISSVLGLDERAAAGIRAALLGDSSARLVQLRMLDKRTVDGQQFEVVGFSLDGVVSDAVAFPLLYDLEWIPDSVVRNGSRRRLAMTSWAAVMSDDRCASRLSCPAEDVRVFGRPNHPGVSDRLIVTGHSESEIAIGETFEPSASRHQVQSC
ncbi:hypothetical protein NY547_18990 [Cnuibacter physcomitrellae]|nr:hypothetical protein [Cnuibacter physcomitrellae]